MIPSDLAARLRFLHEANFFDTSPPVAGLQRSREIQAQLQDLVPGQRFFATLLRTLPDGSFRAIVAGQQVTLSLNASASAGDTLELVATSVTPKMVLAHLADSGATAAQAGSARSTLSPTGQLISFLLTGQPTPKPVPLAASQPLLNTLPLAGAATQQLAPLLRQALVQSGLFYESHQAQWLNGKMDLATLAREPQTLTRQAPPGTALASTPLPPSAGTGLGQTGNAAAPTQAQQTGASQSSPTPGATTGAGNAGLAATTRAGTITATAPVVARAAQPNENGAQTRANAPAVQSSAQSTEQLAPRGMPVAERLLPIVHQQLDALATQQYIWHGVAWPGQAFEWIIEDPRNGEHQDEEDKDEWNTTLRLILPRLGGIEARLHLSTAGVALRLKTADGTSAARLEAGREDLVQALAAADVPLTGMVVEHDDGSA